VIVGGISFGTLLTLFVVPVVYLLLSRKHYARPQVEPVAGPVSTGLASPPHTPV
jgi:multidrug efflux pump